MGLAWIWVRRAVTRLTAARRQGFRIITFGPAPSEHLGALDAFVGHLKRTHGLLSPEEAADHLAGRPAERARLLPCLLTFDGGISSTVHGALDVLDRHGARAVFFVCPGLMAFTGENQRAVIAANLFDGRVKPRDLPPDLRLMTWDEAAGLTDAGHAIGVHGMMYRRLSPLTGEDLRREISGAADEAAEKVGKVDWFASPFGDAAGISPSALAIIAERFRFCRSTVAGVNSPGTPRMALRADAINLDVPLGEAKLAVEGGLDGAGQAARRALDDAASIDATGAGQ